MVHFFQKKQRLLASLNIWEAKNGEWTVYEETTLIQLLKYPHEASLTSRL